MDCLKYQVPQNVRYLDVAWRCIPLFSSLPVEDLCWLVSALVQEKSIIFISNNLGLPTSAAVPYTPLTLPTIFPVVLTSYRAQARNLNTSHQTHHN